MKLDKLSFLFIEILAFSIVVYNNSSQLLDVLLNGNNRLITGGSFIIVVGVSGWYYLKHVHKNW